MIEGASLSSFSEADVPRQVGKIFAITGANAGLGLLTARALARAGAEICLLCRDRDKAAVAIETLRAQAPDGRFAFVPLDLGDLASVAKASEMVRDRYDGIDGLINNAGIGPGARAVTVDGFEKRFGVNFVGPFVLSARLSDLVERRAGRFVTLTSMAYLVSRGIPFDDLEQTHGYGATRAYGVSKLADLMLAVELQRRLAAAGKRATSYVCQPGMAATNLFTQAEGRVLRLLARPMQALIGQPPELGVLPTLLCATAPGIEPGGFHGPTGPRGLKGPLGQITPEPWAVDPEQTSRLWAETQRRTGAHWQVFDG